MARWIGIFASGRPNTATTKRSTRPAARMYFVEFLDSQLPCTASKIFF
jgi:hypothetical protein